MGESSATFTNWKGERGVSEKGAMNAERLFGCSFSYIREGTQPQWVRTPSAKLVTPDDGQNRPLVTQLSVSERPISSVSAKHNFTEAAPPGTTLISAPAIEWADLEVVLMKLNREWPTEARVSFLAVSDHVSEYVKAMVVSESRIPTIAPGDRIAVDPMAQPWDDCVVLVRLKSGRTELFRYRALANDGWEAVAPGDHPLDSERHALKLIGVVVGLNKLKF